MGLPQRHELLKSLRIPTLPAHVEKLTRMIDAPDTGTADIGALIKQDPPLSGKVLRIANSSFYGLREPCTSIEQATTVLGLRLLRNIVVQAALIQRYDHLQALGLDIEQLWRRSVLVGRTSTILRRGSNSPALPSPDEAYLAGLLADVGQVVLLDNLGADYVELHLESLRHSLPLHLAERRTLGTTHAEIGAIVAESWCMPNSVRIAIELHHGRRDSDHAIPAVYLVLRSGQIVDRVLAGNLVGACDAVDRPFEEKLGITPAAVDEAIEKAREFLRAPRLDAA